MSDTVSGRRATDAVWFRVLDRFGLPTLYAVALLGWLVWNAKEDRRERNGVLRDLADGVRTLATTVDKLAAREDRHADAVQALVPRVRLPATGAPSPRVASSTARGEP